MRNRFCVAVLSFCALILPAPCTQAQTLPAEDHVVELGVMFWRPSPELTLSTDALSVAGVNEVDFVQEFGIEDKFFPEFRATLGRNHKFRVSFVTIKYDAETTIQRTIRFEGRTFNIGVPASADIKWNLWKFGYEWDVVSRERGFLGLIVDLKYNRVEASIDSPALTTAAATDTTAVAPTIGVIARGYLAPMVAVTGEFTALSLNRDEFEATIYDFDLYGTVSFGRNVGVQGGYRSVVVDYLVDEDGGDLKMKGPYFGAVVRF
jgi:hypothetical protein